MLNSNGQARKIKNHFNSDIVDYDACCNKVVPMNDEIHNVIVDSIPFDRNSKLKILDLGVGTGLGALKILNEFPNSQLTGIDFSLKMIFRARERLKIFGNRVKLIEADFNKIDFPGKYDVIVSAITIHNSNETNQRKLMSKILNHLNDNGCFLNGDFTKTKSEFLNKKLNEYYKEYLRNNLRGEELRVWLHHAFKEDKPVALENQFLWMKEAGFREIECIWRHQNLAVYYGLK
jgi:tRNA (cmo5U34)-methyltransferase